MAHKCHQCGSTDTSTGLRSFTCLTCGAVTKYAPQEEQGRIENPDGPAHYYGDDGVVYDGGGGLPIKYDQPEKAAKKAG